MSQLINGQLRLMEQSSIRQAMHMGQGFRKGKNPPAPHNPEQTHPGHKKQLSHRGKGKGMKGEVDGETDLRKGSTFTEPFKHFSVGLELIKEAPRDLNKIPILRRRGNRIVHPNRMGKKDKSGMSLPAKKEQAPPKKSSDIVKKQGKKAIKQVMKTMKKKGKPMRDNRDEMEEEIN